MTLAQLPVASLLAVHYFSQQWVERSKTYATRVVDRLALARAAGAMTGGPPDNVMADVLTEDLIDAISALVTGLTTLPGESAEYFNRRLEAMVNDVLMQIQPDAKSDSQTYVVNELEKLNQNLSRLREVAGAETARRSPTGRPGRAAQSDQQDAAALRRLLADLKDIVEGRVPELQSGQRPTAPRERMLLVLQTIVNAALTRFETKRALRPSRRGEEAARKLLARQSAEIKIRERRAELREATSLPRREIKRTRRSGR